MENKIKQIKNINLDNLQAANTILSNKISYQSFIKKKQWQSPCAISYTGEFINKSDYEQTQYTVSCSETFTISKSKQKLNGFSKVAVKNSSQWFTDKSLEANNNNWNWNAKVNLGTKIINKFPIPLVFKRNLDFSLNIITGEKWGKDNTYSREKKHYHKNANSDDITKDELETEIFLETLTIMRTIPSQPILIPKKSKIKVSAYAEQQVVELTLIVNQEVTGKVSASLIFANNNINVNLSIKEIMMTLQANNILPTKISINKNESVNLIYS